MNIAVEICLAYEESVSRFAPTGRRQLSELIESSIPVVLASLRESRSQFTPSCQAASIRFPVSLKPARLAHLLAHYQG
jgi:hypothetical protein